MSQGQVHNRNRRITVRLTPDTELRLRAFAVKRNTTTAELATEAIEQFLAAAGEPPAIYYEWKVRQEQEGQGREAGVRGPQAAEG
ncbi:MAG: hypothetical protein V2I24_09445 [Halieaceae bacterium]|jgi:predicted transcriptional regulator|nr:hypothetical protein [Halieaceae bacterium]